MTLRTRARLKLTTQTRLRREAADETTAKAGTANQTTIPSASETDPPNETAQPKGAKTGLANP